MDIKVKDATSYDAGLSFESSYDRHILVVVQPKSYDDDCEPIKVRISVDTLGALVKAYKNEMVTR